MERNSAAQGRRAAQELFINCLLLYEAYKRELVGADGEEVQYARIRLRKLLSFKARFLSNESLGLRAAKDFPGYLIYSVANVRVYLPWLIIEDLPPREVLDYLIKLAIKIKACSISFMCLSGSALFFKSLKSISDLDFLEYEANAELDPQVINESTELALLAQAKNYLQYIVATPFYGPVEATNKIVRLDTSKSGYGASERSHPYQEVPIMAMPRELDDPISLGGYIRFLVDANLSRRAMQRPAKAAKRLLPLSRILEDRELAHAILGAFDGQELQKALRVKQKVDLLAKIGARAEDHWGKFTALVHQDICDHRADGSQVDELTENESKHLTDLAESMRTILKNYRPNLVKLSFLNGM